MKTKTVKSIVRLTLIALGTLSAAIYLSADAQNPTHREALSRVKRVEVALVETVTDHREVRFSGITRSVRRARLSFPLGGRLVERPVGVGQVVRRDAVIARLDDRELRNAVARAKGGLAELVARRAQTQRDLDRAHRLADAKAATDEEVERSQAAVEGLEAAEVAARAQLRESERLLHETVLRAPFSGTISEVFFEPGEFATVGRPVVMLSGDGEIELSVEVPESVMPHIEIGDEVKVLLPVIGRQLEGRVQSVGRTALGSGHLFPVLVALPNLQGLTAGSTAELALDLTTEDALSVPVEAVVNPGGHRPAVFRVSDEGEELRVEKIVVEVGSLLGDQVTVRGALSLGDQVVVGGQRGLLDGEAVEVKR